MLFAEATEKLRCFLLCNAKSFLLEPRQGVDSRPFVEDTDRSPGARVSTSSQLSNKTSSIVLLNGQALTRDLFNNRDSLRGLKAKAGFSKGLRLRLQLHIQCVRGS